MPDKDSEPRDQGSSPRDQNHEPESNPFVAFRRFADEQVSSVLQSITGLPSSISPPNPDRWTIFTDDQSYKSMAYRHRQGANDRGNDDSRDASAGENSASDGASKSTSSGANDQHSSPSQNSRTSYDSHHHRHSSDEFSPLALQNSFLPPFLPIPGFAHSMDGGDGDSLDWPLEYIIASPYSPIRLDSRNQQWPVPHLLPFFSRAPKQKPDLPEPEWYEAFEDLLRLENGKSMLDRDESAIATRRRGHNPQDWFLGLVNRGSLGDEWRAQRTSAGAVEIGRGRLLGDRENRRPPPEIQNSLHQAGTEEHLFSHMIKEIHARNESLEREMASSSFFNFLRQADARAEQSFKSARDEIESSYAGFEQGTEDTESWLDLVSGGNRKSVPESPEHLQQVSADGFQSGLPSASRVVSTTTRTERVQQADGSIETKRVETKLYEDGREETNSSVERSHADSEPRADINQKPPKGGWFWRD